LIAAICLSSCPREPDFSRFSSYGKELLEDIGRQDALILELR